MSSLAETSGVPGIVKIDHLTFTLMPLTVREELRLSASWRAIADRNGKDARVKEGYRLAALAPNDAMAAAATARVIDREIGGEGPSQSDINAAVDSPEGVATELYHRTRKTHPEVTLDKLKLIITAVNCDNIDEQIRKAVNLKLPTKEGESPKT